MWCCSRCCQRCCCNKFGKGGLLGATTVQGSVWTTADCGSRGQRVPSCTARRSHFLQVHRSFSDATTTKNKAKTACKAVERGQGNEVQHRTKRKQDREWVLKTDLPALATVVKQYTSLHPNKSVVLDVHMTPATKHNASVAVNERVGVAYL